MLDSSNGALDGYGAWFNANCTNALYYNNTGTTKEGSGKTSATVDGNSYGVSCTSGVINECC